MITIEEAKNLRRGQYICHSKIRGWQNKPLRFKVNGNVKTWKTDPNRVRVPLKHGLCEYGYLTEDNLQDFYIPTEGSDDLY